VYDVRAHVSCLAFVGEFCLDTCEKISWWASLFGFLRVKDVAAEIAAKFSHEFDNVPAGFTFSKVAFNDSCL
jgi:hypothetical protein